MNKRWMFLFSPVFLLALPEGEKVVSGEATFQQVDSQTLHIHTQDKTIIHYKNFNIGEKETVRFNQPHSKAVVLNRVKGSDPSHLLGRMASNGKVILVNPNGVFFGPNSEVNVGSLIASTLHLSDENFKKGNYKFELQEGAKNSFIENQGFLSAKEGGCIALLAPHIVQKGVIVARAGQVALLSAPVVTLDFTGDGLMRFVLEGELESAVIEQMGSISALQGNVFLEMRAADQLIRSVVNTDGFVHGEKIVKENGIVRIVSDSQIEAEKIGIQGKNVDISGGLEAQEKLTIQAKETLRLATLQGSADVDMSAKTIVSGGALKANRLNMEAKEAYYIGGDIETLNQDLRFTAPVFFTAGNISLSTGPVGSNIVFESHVNGGPHLLPINLKVSAGRGDVVFKGAVGDLCPLRQLIIESGASITFNSLFAESLIQHAGSGVTTFRDLVKLTGSEWSLSLNGSAFNFMAPYEGGSISLHNTGDVQIGLRADLQITGAFLQTGPGPVIVTGKITATDAISFASRVSVMDAVELFAGSGNRGLTFHSHVDGPGGLTAKGDVVVFEQDIGSFHPLSYLDVTATKSISIGNVAGITDRLELSAGQEVIFKGHHLRAKSQKYKAGKGFFLSSGKLTRFIADSHAGSPIIFEAPLMTLSKGSHLVVETLNGDIRCPSFSLHEPQNITLNAGKGSITFCGLEGEERIDQLTCVADKIAFNGSLKAERLVLNGTRSVSIKGEISVLKGNLNFEGPVVCEGPLTRLSLAGSGELAFLSTLEGSGDLFLTAPEGLIRFEGALGGAQQQFASLTVVANTIDQNAAVRATGPIVYTGKTYLGNKISTSGNAIVFNGPVIRDGVDSVALTTQKGAFSYKLQGDIIFNGSLDADIPTRSLSINTGAGSVYFKEGIGQQGAFQNMTVSGRNITFGPVGATFPGVTQLLHATAEETICYRGSNFHVGSLRASAKVHEVKYLGTASFVSTPPEEGVKSQNVLAFSGGVIKLAEGVHLSMQGKRADIHFMGIEGSKQEKVSLTAEGGNILLGSLSSGIDRINIKGENLFIHDGIQAHYVSLQAAQNILYSNKSQSRITSGSDVILQAHAGSIGTLAEPIYVECVGKIRVGAKDIVNINGMSYDYTAHIFSGQRPSTLIFNTFEYQQPAYIEFIKEEMETLSLAPDLDTGGRRDSIDSSAILPRRVGVYFINKE